jgi:molybdate transport system substrate-binding protein
MLGVLWLAVVSIAAASDLNFAIKDIAGEFERSTGNQVRLTLGSSGNFYAQIVNGAPFEVFLSADTSYPRELQAAGRAGSEIFVYGVGRIVLWTSNRSDIDVERLGMKALLQPSVRKIAIANPEHAPYGRAAVVAMQRAGVYDRVKDKLVLGENISQTAQFVQSGAADVGIVALSLALSDPMRRAGRYWVVPADTYPRMEQGAVLLKGASPAARAFFEWLRTDQARKIFERYGFVGKE